MALHSAIKGKLIAVIGDEVSITFNSNKFNNLIINQKVGVFALISNQLKDYLMKICVYLSLGHLCRLLIGRNRRNKSGEDSEPEFYGCGQKHDNH